MSALSIFQSILSKYIPKEEKENHNQKMKHKNFIDEKFSIIFKTVWFFETVVIVCSLRLIARSSGI